ncbi:hypothetical protein CEXT_567091 [Caerostris extrusa]|uniref:Uncharacterized protein n=1 Tax=Caerostris extrusa TaxID=172846 RepID=A0AAV4NBN0_CAEEX|nr:hypothetical protein CEXT_567091 [Caerostris extrusa]
MVGHLGSTQKHCNAEISIAVVRKRGHLRPTGVAEKRVKHLRRGRQKGDPMRNWVVKSGLRVGGSLARLDQLGARHTGTEAPTVLLLGTRTPSRENCF